MLKTSLIESARQRRLIIEGKLIAPWAAELRRACEKSRADLRSRELVIEMKHAMTISQEGENVILELINEGTKFSCDGIYKACSERGNSPRKQDLGTRAGD